MKLLSIPFVHNLLYFKVPIIEYQYLFKFSFTNVIECHPILKCPYNIYKYKCVEDFEFIIFL